MASSIYGSPALEASMQAPALRHRLRLRPASALHQFPHLLPEARVYAALGQEALGPRGDVRLLTAIIFVGALENSKHWGDGTGRRLRTGRSSGSCRVKSSPSASSVCHSRSALCRCFFLFVFWWTSPSQNRCVTCTEPGSPQAAHYKPQVQQSTRLLDPRLLC